MAPSAWRRRLLEILFPEVGAGQLLLTPRRAGRYSGLMMPSDSGSLPARRLTARITGEVQAVGFRYRTLQQAMRLGLTGVVSNSPDGSVHVVAEGPQPAVDGLREWLGSPAAPGTVHGIEEAFSDATGEFPDFTTG